MKCREKTAPCCHHRREKRHPAPSTADPVRSSCVSLQRVSASAVPTVHGTDASPSQGCRPETTSHISNCGVCGGSETSSGAAGRAATRRCAIYRLSQSAPPDGVCGHPSAALLHAITARPTDIIVLRTGAARCIVLTISGVRKIDVSDRRIGVTVQWPENRCHSDRRIDVSDRRIGVTVTGESVSQWPEI